MNSDTRLPDYDPNLLETQIALAREMHRRGMFTDEQLQQELDRLRDEDTRRRGEFIAAGYRKYNIPHLLQEARQSYQQEQRRKAASSGRWLYSWNLEPANDPCDFAGLVWWEDDTERVRAESRKQATSNVAAVDVFHRKPLDWLWPGRLPLGKVSLLTGDASEGKSLVALDLLSRVTTGRDWPDRAAAPEPADVLLIAPDVQITDVIIPRLEAARADLSRVQLLSWVDWQDRRSGQTDGDAFRLPVDGPILESILAEHDQLRLIVIDPLSDFLTLPPASAECSAALHDILSDLEELAAEYRCSILCVETARRGGIIGMAAGRQWRAHYDPAFMTVWGVARDPRDRSQRLYLPVRHQLGDDRTGFPFTIEPYELGTARIAWGEPEDSISFAEATGRVRLGRSIWSFSQTADAEAWLREFLKQGEKPSVEIFQAARALGFTENPVRNALRRVADKFKQGFKEGWIWRLKEM